jgi:outer membrane protein
LNQKVLCSVLALGLAGLAAAQTPAPAAKPAGPAPTKIAVINIQQAIANTKDGKKASADLQTKFGPRRSTLEKRQTDLQAMGEQLRRGSATMSEDAKAKMQRDIDANTKSLQRDAQDLNDDADQDQSKILNEIGGKMMQVIDQYATQNGYAVVLDVSNQQTPVIWASAATEITAEIVQLYDQAHPGGTSAAPAARPPAAAAPKPPAAKPPAAAPAPAGRKQ